MGKIESTAITIPKPNIFNRKNCLVINMPKKGKITERTLYPFIKEIVRELGGSSVSEIKYNSEPDIVFNFAGYQWLMSIKIGETAKIIKDAFVQYFRHKKESGITYGIIAFFPEDIRKTRPLENAVREAINYFPATCLIDAPTFQAQVRDSLPNVLRYIADKVKEKFVQTYPLELVVKLLRQQIEEIMYKMEIKESQFLTVISNPELFFGIGKIEQKRRKDVLRFLATYILISQLLFLRLFSVSNPEIIAGLKEPTREMLRRAFRRILDINYRPIYEVDVLDLVHEKFLKDAFDLICGLKVEKLRYEIPGRLFHELMPEKIRKLLAAFYTRPQAADILANLGIERGDATVLDPACGSGTILTSAYKRKAEFFINENKEEMHRKFCEEQIFGIDIMPFAVHLTTANLAAMNPSVTIDRAQIIEGDSLKIAPHIYVRPGIYQLTFTEPNYARKRTGERYEIKLKKVDVILMNPPFTKIERRIGDYIDLSRFKAVVGGEVGLWGHFIPLADAFLKKDGIFGAVLPINLLRGRESEKVRKFIFDNWTPLYILKPTYNYGFTEWSEYRDIILIAEKRRSKNYHVKFCLIKKDLKEISDRDVKRITETVKASTKLRSKELDIETFSKEEILEHFTNLMWFCGVSDFTHRDILVKFIKKFDLEKFPEGYFREGYRPVPKGVSSFMFITRPPEERLKEAFLRLEKENDVLYTKTELGVTFKLKREDFLPSLRTPIGLKTMDINRKWDYVACKKYEGINDVLLACGFKGELPDWNRISEEVESVKTNIVVTHRINPFSPNTHLIAFYSDQPIHPSNQLNVVQEKNKEKAKAVCVILNSAIFLAYFFLLKEESTGRYINIRFYDLYEMNLYPSMDSVKKLASIFDMYANSKFPSLRDQLDMNFESRYKAFWKEKRNGTNALIDIPIQPHPLRIKFDKDVANALGVNVSEKELKKVYDVIVREMIMIRGLKKD